MRAAVDERRRQRGAQCKAHRRLEIWRDLGSRVDSAAVEEVEAVARSVVVHLQPEAIVLGLDENAPICLGASEHEACAQRESEQRETKLSHSVRSNAGPPDQGTHSLSVRGRPAGGEACWWRGLLVARSAGGEVCWWRGVEWFSPRSATIEHGAIGCVCARDGPLSTHVHAEARRWRIGLR